MLSRGPSLDRPSEGGRVGGVKRFVWLFAVVCGLALSAEEPFRVWTDKKGQTMEARLISIADDKIEIIRKDGVSFTVSPNIFSERDRNYIDEVSKRVVVEEQREKPFTIRDLSIEMLWCPPGTFEMAHLGFGINAKLRRRRSLRIHRVHT